MLLVKTSIRPSKIHGNGVFADEIIAAGAVVWRYEPLFDRTISETEMSDTPPAFRDYLKMYAYCSRDLEGNLILLCDNARFLNHSPIPNTSERPFFSVANIEIAVGQEITCDYASFCAEGLDFEVIDPETNRTQLTKDNLPHENLYTRIKPSAHGVGVFAIRDVPQGTALFVGDLTATVDVDKTFVEAIPDPEIKRMYIDFCPIIDGNFRAPADFNRMTMGWHINHSDNPNVAVVGDLQFVADQHIFAGQELTVDYTRYSDDAAALIRDWTEMAKT
jgi:hypothetical protein